MRKATFVIWALAAALGLAAPAGAKTACSTAGARYRMAQSPDFTAGFARAPKGRIRSDVGFFVRSAHTGRTFWFSFDQGSSPQINLISTTDPTAPDWKPPNPDGPQGRVLPDMTYLQADEHFRFATEAPGPEGKAPQYILLPELQDALWHGPEPREAVPLAFFRRVSCGTPGR